MDTRICILEVDPIIKVDVGIGESSAVSPDNWSDKYVGDGSTTAFILTYAAQANTVFVWVNGILQQENVDYTLNSTYNIVTFLAAPLLGRRVEIYYIIAGQGYAVDDFLADGERVLFILSLQAKPNSDILYMNGILCERDIEYVLAADGRSITFTSAPRSGYRLTAIYTPISEYVIDELTANGSDSRFLLSDIFEPGACQVYSNGWLQEKNVDYVESVDRDFIEFNSIPRNGWKIVVRYLKPKFSYFADRFICNASRTTFPTTYAFRSNSCMAFLDGLLVYKDIDYSEAVDLNQVTSLYTIENGKTLYLNYALAGSWAREQQIANGSDTVFELEDIIQPNSLFVFVNGLLKAINVDYAESANSIHTVVTFTEASLASSAIVFIYALAGSFDYMTAFGDGELSVFGFEQAFKVNSLLVFVDGALKIRGFDYMESIDNLSITFNVSPAIGARLEARYEVA